MLAFCRFSSADTNKLLQSFKILELAYPSQSHLLRCPEFCLYGRYLENERSQRTPPLPWLQLRVRKPYLGGDEEGLDHWICPSSYCVFGWSRHPGKQSHRRWNSYMNDGYYSLKLNTYSNLMSRESDPPKQTGQRCLRYLLGLALVYCSDRLIINSGSARLRMDTYLALD